MRSLPQMEAYSIRTRTSPSCGVGVSTSRISNCLGPTTRAAFMFPPARYRALCVRRAHCKPEPTGGQQQAVADELLAAGDWQLACQEGQSCASGAFRALEVI